MALAGTARDAEWEGIDSMTEELPHKDERAASESDIDYIEVYLPKKLEHLSELYRYLREKIGKEHESHLFHGFSVYEVDGVFLGRRKKIWEERSLVIRVLFMRPEGVPDSYVLFRIRDLGRELATQVAPHEEQIWICHHQYRVIRFFPKDYPSS
jgi:hypothetical protein